MISETPMTDVKLRRIILPDLKGHAIFWLLFLGGLGLDLWTKSAVGKWMAGRGRFEVIDGLLRLVWRQNPGAAFNLFSGRAVFLVSISVVALIVVVGIFFLGGARQRLAQVALGLFAGGISGNLYDRMFNGGQVRDFIEAYIRDHLWPAFNVADSLLFVGVVLLIISTITVGKSDQKRDQQQKSECS